MKRVFMLLLYVLVCLSVLSASIEAENSIRLVIRGDDLGMTQGSLVAFERAFNRGVMTCGAVQAPAPWFEAAAELCKKNSGWCVGVHLTLVGEWRGYRWRPVLSWDKVSSIVDEDGYFYQYPEELFATDPDINEIEMEFRAQIELALKKGINVQYIDTHYQDFTSYPGLEDVFKKLSRDYDVPISTYMGEKFVRSVYTDSVEDKLENAVSTLESLTPGLWIMVYHPGVDTPEQNALIHTLQKHIVPGGGVGKHRAEETNVLSSIEMKSVILKKGIKLVNYSELWEEQKVSGAKK